MADPRRLGKRGAYRLGELRTTGSWPERGPKVPARHEPSFRPRRSRGPLLAALIGCAATAAVLGLGAGLGWWFLPFVAGIVAGAGPWRTLPALGLVVLAVIVGWGAALWWPALSGAPVGATARVIAALAGLPPHAAVGVAATLLIGILQAVVAFWLARALTYRLRQLGQDGAGRPGHAFPSPEICRELVISEATAKTHVAKILQKLGLRDRVQAVIYAYESGLVTPGPTS